MTNESSKYADFRFKVEQISNLIERCEPVFKDLRMKNWQDNAKKLLVRLRTDTFKVLVIGEFKRGKSTLINAMLGDEILPAFATPCTAVINEIKWGEEKRSLLHIRNDVDKDVMVDLQARLADEGKGVPKREGAPIEIGIDEIEKFVVIPDPAQDQARSVAESPFDHVEIFWPLDLCRNGVEIIDSPGLNEHGTRTKVTTDYLSRVDAVLFVMSCQVLASESEMQVVENYIKASGHEYIFFIANRFDQIRKRERERLVQYALQKLSKHTKFGSEGVHFLSAADALDGRLESDDALVEDSGILKLESSLAQFLTSERGKIKLLQPAKELLYGVREAREKEIQRQLEMLSMDSEKLEERYQKVKPDLEDAEHKKRQIVEKINNHRSRLGQEVRRITMARLRELKDLVGQWVDEYEPETEFSMLKLSTKQQLEAIAKEIAEAIASKIEESQSEWQRKELSQVIEERLADMMDAISYNVDDFYTKLDGISTTITGLDTTVSAGERDISPTERILAAAGGFLVAGVGSAAIGVAFGYKEMLKSLGPQIALIVGMVFIGITNPLVLVGAMLAGGTLQGLLKAEKLKDKVKKTVGEQIQQQIADSSADMVEKITEEILKKTKDIENAIGSGLEKEIQSKRDQVQKVKEELAKGQAHVEEKKKELEGHRATLNEVNNGLQDIVFSLVGA